MSENASDSKVTRATGTRGEGKTWRFTSGRQQRRWLTRWSQRRGTPSTCCLCLPLVTLVKTWKVHFAMSCLRFCLSAPTSRHLQIKTGRKEAAVGTSARHDSLGKGHSDSMVRKCCDCVTESAWNYFCFLSFDTRVSSSTLFLCLSAVCQHDRSLMSFQLRAPSHAINQLFSRKVWWCHLSPPSFTPIMATADDGTSIPSISAWRKERRRGGVTSGGDNQWQPSEE